MRISDWSSDVCSSDLTRRPYGPNRSPPDQPLDGRVRAGDQALPRRHQDHRGRRVLALEQLPEDLRRHGFHAGTERAPHQGPQGRDGANRTANPAWGTHSTPVPVVRPGWSGSEDLSTKALKSKETRE